PKQATWGPAMVTFVDETGTEISLPQALVSDVTAQSEVKGYGRVIDTTTVDLGYMPNDLDQSQQLMQQQAQQAALFGQSFGGNTGTQGPAFLEPGEPGAAGGIPFGFTGIGNAFNTPTGFVPGSIPTPPGTTPAPFTTPTNTVTPAPFTIPSPGAAAPTTTTPSTPPQ